MDSMAGSYDSAIFRNVCSVYVHSLGHRSTYNTTTCKYSKAYNNYSKDNYKYIIIPTSCSTVLGRSVSSHHHDIKYVYFKFSISLSRLSKVNLCALAKVC